jgi:hypothetical protein
LIGDCSASQVFADYSIVPVLRREETYLISRFIAELNSKPDKLDTKSNAQG